MSTVKVTNLQNASSASPNIVLDTSGNATMAGSMAMATPFAMKNKIINGAMEIDQRNAGASITPTANVYSLDRWYALVGAASKMSFQQSSIAPTGFTKSLVATTVAAYTPGATETFALLQPIEGFNVSDLGFGTASAKTVTLSFWVRSSLTGTFGGALSNDGYNRSYPFTYTINSANTFEYKTITIPGDTTGTWTTNNSAGLRVYFGLGVGSTYSGTAGSWVGAFAATATGATSVVGTNGATFYLTGVQLEVDSVATPFERRLYPQELAMCQRYYQKASGNQYSSYGATYNYVQWYFKVTMRASPTLTGTTGSSGSLTTDFASLWTAGSAYASFADATASAEL